MKVIHGVIKMVDWVYRQALIPKKLAGNEKKATRLVTVKAADSLGLCDTVTPIKRLSPK